MVKTKDVTIYEQTEELGAVNISTYVIETIAGQAANEIEGVSLSGGSFAFEAGNLLSSERRSPSTNARVTEFGEIIVDVNIHIAYGYSVPVIALAVQERVKEQILYMTDLIVHQVNVHILSIDTMRHGSDELYHIDGGQGE